jgi:hypothetical protein
MVSVESNLHERYGQINKVRVEVQNPRLMRDWLCWMRQYWRMNHFFIMHLS